jgi:hypothetical protein
MVNGIGDPNEEDGAYQKALTLLYALSYTVKMSKHGSFVPPGYFEYSVPPLEGLWWMADGTPGVDYARKDGFAWTAMIRQPDFVTAEVFSWACGEVRRKKGIESSPSRLETLDEGLCVQCMHLGPYEEEPATIAGIEAFIRSDGLVSDTGPKRRHHEIYLSDPRRTAPEKMKTVLRIPVWEA